jgi:hypothetical protein
MIIHVTSRYPSTDPEVQRRQALAQATWQTLPWIEHPRAESDLPRLFSEGAKKLPYIRDLFDTGNEYGDEAIVVFSNADIGFATNACLMIALAMQANDAGYAYRRDFGRVSRIPTDAEIPKGNDYCGTDVFFFRVSWWKQVRAVMPDMLLGREAWDACFRVIVEATNPNKPLAVPNICWHERHGGQGHWEAADKRYTLPGQKYNLALAKQFLLGSGLNPATFGIR